MSQLMLPRSSFEEDVEACARLGVGLGVSEAKLGPGRDGELLGLVRNAGVRSGVAVPTVIGPLKDAWRGGPDDPDERTEAVCAGIDRLAAFEPASILVVTGAKAFYPVFEARRIVVDGLTRIAAAAHAHGLDVGVEILRDETNGSLYNDLPRTFDLLEDVGADNLRVVFDIWHLWDAPNVFEQLEIYAPRISAVQLCDWRAITRWNGDRVFPGEGLADTPRLLDVLESNGFGGVYDLEIFSDASKPDSIWENRSLHDVLERSWERFAEAWVEAGLA